MFYTNVATYYDLIFTNNDAKAKFLSKNCLDKSKIIDIGCSTGKLDLLLSNKFEQITAIDLNQDMITYAVKNHSKSNINYQLLNMLDLESKFKANSIPNLFSFGNTLVHLANEQQISDFIQSVHKILSDDGTFALQLLNYEMILSQKLSELPLIDNEEITFQRKYHYRTDGMIDFNTLLTIKTASQKIKNSVKLYPICKNSLIKLLTRAGFTNIECFSSWNSDHFDPNKLPLIIKCRK